MLYVQYPSWIKPEIFPPLMFRWYGLMYIFAFVTGYLYIVTQIKKEKNAPLTDQIINIITWGFIGMILGARFASELIYNKNLSILIRPWELVWPFRDGHFVGLQGMSYHGGVTGIILATFIYCRIYRINYGKFADIAVTGAAFGYTWGRIGNFTNGELYGRITAQPWGMVFPRAESLPIADPRVEEIASKIGIEANPLGLVNLPRHPSQLYESFFEGLVVGLILMLLYNVLKNNKRYIPGMFVAIYLILYGIARFILEYFRQPDQGLDFVIKLTPAPSPNWALVSLLNFTTGQVLSGVMIMVGIAALIGFQIVRSKQIKKERIRVSV